VEAGGMNTRTIGIVVLVVGVILLLVSLGADLIGVGTRNAFGYKQIIGTVVGGVLAIGGIVLMTRKAAP
jgi:hypothetical protein